MAKAKPAPLHRTCFDCDHLYACQAWAGAGQLMHTDATHCANYQTVDALHKQLMTAQEVIGEQNEVIERYERMFAQIDHTRGT